MIRADTCWQVGYPRINRHQATLTLSGLCTGGHGPSPLNNFKWAKSVHQSGPDRVDKLTP